LSVAARAGNADVVKLLLENGACVEVEDHYGRTAAQWASRGGYVAITRLLDGLGVGRAREEMAGIDKTVVASNS
jgi:hypothetical protein